MQISSDYRHPLIAAPLISTPTPMKLNLHQMLMSHFLPWRLILFIFMDIGCFASTVVIFCYVIYKNMSTL